ncbi:MAG: CCA tRNA nucleotidyltransferase [Candidatus Limnocylindrales bacterium]
MAPQLRLPLPVLEVIERLRSSGHAAYAVGGSVRDLLAHRHSTDHDVATDARPERLLELFPGSRYENRFGTVTAPGPLAGVQITTFRRDHVYGDHRRPNVVTFTDNLDEDLRRRDFTMNAIAYGGGPGSRDFALVDPTGGRADIAAQLVRAVGDPLARFDEDALRLVRAVRLAAKLGFEIEPRTAAAIRASAGLATILSAERVGFEMSRLLAVRPPSRGMRLLGELELLEPLLPELAAQQGVAQNKLPGKDLWDHTLATADAAAELAPDDHGLRLAALLHDVGKPATMNEGRFPRHAEVGAEMARPILDRLAVPRRESERVTRLVAAHMFDFQSGASDAAVRRFIRRVGPDLVLDVLRLREADNIGSGHAGGAGGLDELRDRVMAEFERGSPLTVRELAVDGNELQTALAISPGPPLGQLLSHLLDLVLTDPARNNPDELIRAARAWLAERSAAREPQPGREPPPSLP